MRSGRHFTLRALCGCAALPVLLFATSRHCDAQANFGDSTAARLPALRYENGMDVEVADLDNDGDLDIVIANEFQPNTVMLNDGAGKFTESSAALPSVIHDSEDIGIADFDGDGDPDIIFVSEDDRIHEYYLNDGAGRFKAAPSALPQSVANAVAVADVSGDGRPDLLIGNAGQDFLLVNDGTGGFVDETSVRLPAESNVTQDVEFADVDRDGDLDIVIGNEDGNRLLDNDGQGIFTDVTAQRLPTPPRTETRKVTLYDVDRDGDLDIYVSNVGWNPGNNGQDRLYINNAGVFTDETAARLPQNIESTLDAKFIDFDDDGDADIVTCHFPQSPPRAWRNNGTGIFTDATTEVFGTPAAGAGLGIEVFDVNRDGRLEVYLCNRGQRDRLFMRAAAATSVDGNTQRRAVAARCIPNPFSDRAELQLDLEHAGVVAVAVVSPLGETVASLPAERRDRGRHVLPLPAGGLAGGVYFVRITSGGLCTVVPVARERRG